MSSLVILNSNMTWNILLLQLIQDAALLPSCKYFRVANSLLCSKNDINFFTELYRFCDRLADL